MQNREVVDVFCLHRQLPGLAQHQQVRLPAVTQEQDSSSGGRLYSGIYFDHGPPCYLVTDLILPNEVVSGLEKVDEHSQ